MKVQRTITLAIAFALAVLGTVACSKNSTPTKAIQTFYDAMKNKDAKALKSVMPKETLDAGENYAKAHNKSFDDVIKEEFFDNERRRKDFDKTPEFRNETIASDGKTATVEVKDADWVTIHLIKEDDGWKIKDRF